MRPQNVECVLIISLPPGPHKSRQPVEAASKFLNSLAPEVGFEPTTLRLTAGCSTVELLRNKI